MFFCFLTQASKFRSVSVASFLLATTLASLGGQGALGARTVLIIVSEFDVKSNAKTQAKHEHGFSCGTFPIGWIPRYLNKTANQIKTEHGNSKRNNCCKNGAKIVFHSQNIQSKSAAAMQKPMTIIH